MKYKVILYNNLATSALDVAGAFTFYTRAAAEECCYGWVSLSSDYEAYLWDGITWRYIT